MCHEQNIYIYYFVNQNLSFHRFNRILIWASCMTTIRPIESIRNIVKIHPEWPIVITDGNISEDINCILKAKNAKYLFFKSISNNYAILRYIRLAVIAFS